MKTPNQLRIFTLLFAAIIIAVGMIPAAGQATKKKITYYSVKSGTVIRARLDKNMSSKTAYAGEPFKSTVVDPIYSSGGVLLIPAGSKIQGHVRSAKPAAKNGEPGTIDVTFTTVTLPNKRYAAISGMLVALDPNGANADNEGQVSGKKTSHRNAKFIGGGAAGGAIIGGIAGGGTGAAIGAGVGAVAGLVGKKAKKGSEAEAKAGVEFGVYLGKAISLPKYQ